MAKIRTIKPEFFRSRSLARVPVGARLTFAGLWTEADDGGRGVADPRIIKGALWALDDDVTPAIVAEWLEMLADTGHIRLYDVDGDQFYEVISFERHQSAAYRRGSAVHPTPASIEDAPTSTFVPLHDSACDGVQDACESVQPARDGVLLRKGKEGKGSAKSLQGCNDFDAFWATYPQRIGKRAAATAWDRATRRAPPDEILAGLNRALPELLRREPKFVPNPATWLNQDRWADEPRAAVASDSPFAGTVIT